MSISDRHYTPERLAAKLAALLPSDCSQVVDLAVGRGSLLEAVERASRGEVLLAGADVDPVSTSALRVSHPSWIVSQADSLNPASYRSSSAYRRSAIGYDAAVLNPPFSYRGGKRIGVLYGHVEYRVTPATAFLSHAMSWIRPTGTIVAIVPENVMNIRGDRELWAAWKSKFRVETIEVLDRYAFPSARTTTMLVRLSLGERPLLALGDRQVSRRAATEAVSWSGNECRCIEVIRGRVPLHRLSELSAADGLPIVHSTNLREGVLTLPSSLVDARLGSEGPMVLLPRVGTPNAKKIASSRAESLVLSDCVYGLRPGDHRNVLPLLDLLRSDFDALAERFSGSCALYLTVDELVEWLRSRHLDARQVRAGSAPACYCDRSEHGLTLEPASWGRLVAAKECSA